jgi:hypothetical protein
MASTETTAVPLPDLLTGYRTYVRLMPRNSKKGRAVGAMHILNETGHTEVAWDPLDSGSVAVAEREFDKLSTKGFSAFVRPVPDEEMFRIDSFVPSADEILWVKPLVGG